MAKQLNTEGPRDRILQTAAHLFYQQGYHGTGINQIISEAKVAKASFYDHFGSKEELAVAYLEQRSAQIIGYLTATEVYSTPADRVAAIFEFLEQFVINVDFTGCAFLNIASEFPITENRIRDAVVAHKTTQRALITDLIREVQADPDDPRHQAIGDMIYLLFESALVESRVFRAVWPVQRARESAMSVLS